VSAKLGEGAMFLAQFVGGVVVGFYYSWDVALVACATAPPCTFGLYYLTMITSDTAAKLTAAYSKAGGVASETIYNMRTVASLQCEEIKSGKGMLSEFHRYNTNVLTQIYRVCLNFGS